MTAFPMVARASAASARERQRRLTWNNDGSDMLQAAYAGGKWPIPLKSVDQFINSLTRFLEGTQVDSIFYCAYVNEPDWEFPRKYIEVLGPKPCAPIVDFARKNNMEFFWSIRMNDVHAGRYAPKASYWPPFRRAHPELLMCGLTREQFDRKVRPWLDKYIAIENQRWEQRLYQPEKEAALLQQSDAEHPLADVLQRHGRASRDVWFWAGYNWALEGTRAHYLEAIEGACERYDLDGIEMDWCRHPMFFKLGEERRNSPIMNDFVHLVRQRLKQHGERRGRPILLAMRVPDSIELCLTLGLDPETWAKQGWMDLLNAGTGFMPFSINMREWVQLGRQYNIPVYGCLDRLYSTFRTGKPKFDHRDPPIQKDRSSDYDATMAACHRFWEEGVDGIYLYDWHTHHGPTDPADYGSLQRLADAKAIARHDKLYRIDTDRTNNAAIAAACIPGQLPLAFSTNAGASSASLTLQIADTPQTASRAAVRVQWKPEIGAERSSWKVNGAPLAKGRPFVNKRYGTSLGERYGSNYGNGFEDDPGWTEFPIEPGQLKKGQNTLEVTLRPAGDGANELVELAEVQVAIAYS